MRRPGLEVADIVRRHAPDYPHALHGEQARVLSAIKVCRTAELGGHREKCKSCGHERIAYNSCRDRHCNKCQALARATWVAKQVAELLPVPYFHVVFTMPPCIASIALQNQRVVYDILFRAVSETLTRIAADPKHLGAVIGFLAVLHTWGQSLHYHPHLHCIVPGGGLSSDGSRWVPCRRNFLFPVKVLSALYRGLFLAHLAEARARGQLEFHGTLVGLRRDQAFSCRLQEAYGAEWVVYAKAPFGGPKQVVAYLGRYTHRVAISNDRLLKLEDGQVTFRWKDYRDGNTLKTMALEAHEFIRRLLLHVLPKRFVRIRHFALLANRNRPTKLARCRELFNRPAPAPAILDWKAQYEQLTGRAIDQCPACKQGLMQVVQKLPSAHEQRQQLLLGHFQPALLLSTILAARLLARLRPRSPPLLVPA